MILFQTSTAEVSQQQFTKHLVDLGLKSGDTLMLHSRLYTLGRPALNLTKAAFCQAILDSIFEVIGLEGTLIVPTFTLSFCKTGVFNPAKTPTEMGVFAEFVRSHPQSVRSKNPIHSIAAMGKRKVEFSLASNNSSFGGGSVFDLLNQKLDAKLVTIGVENPFEAITFVHYFEQKFSVPYRFLKTFSGQIVDDEKSEPIVTSFFVRKNPDTQFFDYPKCYDVFLAENHPAVEIPLGSGKSFLTTVNTINSFLSQKLTTDINFLLKVGG